MDNTQKVLSFINKNKGISTKELVSRQKEIGISTTQIYSALYLLKANKRIYSKTRKHYVHQNIEKIDKTAIPTANPTIKELVLKNITNEPGISTKDLIKKAGSTTSGIYSAIWALKKDGNKISSKGGRYFIKNGKIQNTDASKIIFERFNADDIKLAYGIQKIQDLKLREDSTAYLRNAVIYRIAAENGIKVDNDFKKIFT